ncbi:MAG: acyl-CoA desaturase [Desulfobacteraceae bacterium]
MNCIISYQIYGFISILIIFNIGHDAVHQCISKNKYVNASLGYFFNILGGNKSSWYLKHNIGHHLYTNIHTRDIDCDTTPFFRVSLHTDIKWWYQFQHLYIIPLYAILSLILIFFIDFKVLLIFKDEMKNPLKEWAIIFISKTVYIIYILILPSIYNPISLSETLFCFLLMHFQAGLLISLVLLPSHFISGNAFYKANSNYEDNSWIEHQLLTTTDIAPNSRVVNFICGGLNTNVIHHIFPKVCHIHLVELSDILKNTADHFNMPYRYYSLTEAILAHFKFLKRMGKAKAYE